MNFDLHLYGETPEELLNVLAHLGHSDSNYHTPIPDERHPAQAPAPQPQSEPVTQSDKPKAQTPAKQGHTEARSDTCGKAAGGPDKPYGTGFCPGRTAGAYSCADCPVGGNCYSAFR